MAQSLDVTLFFVVVFFLDKFFSQPMLALTINNNCNTLHSHMSVKKDGGWRGWGQRLFLVYVDAVNQHKRYSIHIQLNSLNFLFLSQLFQCSPSLHALVLSCLLSPLLIYHI